VDGKHSAAVDGIGDCKGERFQVGGQFIVDRAPLAGERHIAVAGRGSARRELLHLQIVGVW